MAVLGRLRPAQPTSIRNKVALLFFAITALAFSIIYFLVVPELESNLKEQRLHDLSRNASSSSRSLEVVMGRDITAAALDRLVRAVADGAGAEVTLLGAQRSGAARSGRLRFYVISDSREGSQLEENQPLAAAAVRRGRVQSDLVTVRGVELGQAAQPLYYRGRPDWVAVYSRRLDDVAESVSVVRRQVLLAGGVALLVALAGGYLIARALARRVRRLESAARQVAAGQSIEPLPVDSEDELGQLTRTFNEMQEQLARVDRLRKDFIANASHELRTPIFSLGGFMELLQDEDVDEETRREFLGDMREQIVRLQKLSVELLDLSRLDSGSLELASEPVDLAELARGILGEFTPALAQHGTDLELKLPAEGAPARCDRERVAQIMRILLDNVLTHTPTGTHVTVTAARQDGVAEFTVTDTGPGLSPEAAEQAFERFYTADHVGSSGLGLSIAKELAELMSGRIILRSREGETAFKLELPAGDGAP